MRSVKIKQKAHRLSFLAGEDIQYGVLPSAALLEHDHPALLLIELQVTERPSKVAAVKFLHLSSFFCVGASILSM